MSNQSTPSYFVEGEPLSVSRVARLTASQEKRLVVAAKKSGVKVGAYMRAVLNHATTQGWVIEQRADITERVFVEKKGGRSG